MQEPSTKGHLEISRGGHILVSLLPFTTILLAVLPLSINSSVTKLYFYIHHSLLQDDLYLPMNVFEHLLDQHGPTTFAAIVLTMIIGALSGLITTKEFSVERVVEAVANWFDMWILASVSLNNDTATASTVNAAHVSSQCENDNNTSEQMQTLPIFGSWSALLETRHQQLSPLISLTISTTASNRLTCQNESAIPATAIIPRTDALPIVDMGRRRSFSVVSKYIRRSNSMVHSVRPSHQLSRDGARRLWRSPSSISLCASEETVIPGTSPIMMLSPTCSIGCIESLLPSDPLEEGLGLSLPAEDNFLWTWKLRTRSLADTDWIDVCSLCSNEDFFRYWGKIGAIDLTPKKMWSFSLAEDSNNKASTLTTERWVMQFDAVDRNLVVSIWGEIVLALIGFSQPDERVMWSFAYCAKVISTENHIQLTIFTHLRRSNSQRARRVLVMLQRWLGIDDSVGVTVEYGY